MSYTYSSWSTALASAAVTTATDADFAAILPSVIDYAEQRIYRELDLLATVVRDDTGSLTANSREFTLPTSLGRFVIVNGMNVVTPVSTTVTNGTRNPLMLTSLMYADYTWPSNTAPATPSVPQWWAMVTDQTAVVAPAPDAAYNIEVVGTIRPTPLSVSNTTTFLTLYLPDLFFAASMVFVSGWQKNFGSQSDDPRMAVSWEAQTNNLMASAKGEEIRKKYAASVGMMPTKAAA